MRVQPRGCLRRLVPVLGGANVVARRLEEQRDVGGAVARLAAEPRDQALRDRATERRAPGRAQRRVERVVVDVVREPIPQRQLAIVRFMLLDEAHERVLALEPLQPILDFVLGSRSSTAATIAESKSIPCTLAAPEQPAIRVVQRVDLALHQAADGLRHRLLERRRDLRR